jgi:2-polyprenyl-3-methyl-5-hydroxy-6-metoxy-1,4-benzoquinol methylase
MLSHGLKKTLKKIRAFSTSWMTDQTLDYLHAMRVYELGRVLEMLPPSGRVLEIGAGTGWQAQVLERRGYQVSAIDLAQSPYRADRVWPVAEYDGRTIPFGDGLFDIVFTSNVLEHIPHVREFQKEIHRVLKPEGGCCMCCRPAVSGCGRISPVF